VAILCSAGKPGSSTEAVCSLGHLLLSFSPISVCPLACLYLDIAALLTVAIFAMFLFCLLFLAYRYLSKEEKDRKKGLITKHSVCFWPGRNKM